MGEGKQPLVSVVIPAYNRVHTLPQSIGSVLGQTYRNLEVLVVDDGSDDGTEEYVKSIADERIRYIKSDRNRGPSAARNRGAKLARGEYLAFQDSDDEWMEDKLEKQMNLMLECPDLSMVYCEYGRWQMEELMKIVPSREISGEDKQGDLFSYLLQYPLVSTQTIVIKTSDFLAEQGFNEALKSYEDFEFSLRFSQNHRIGFVGEPLVRVNDSRGSVNTKYGERIRTQFYMVREMLEPLRERNLLEKKLWIVFSEAQMCFCHDIFIEELKALAEELFYGNETETAVMLLDKMERDREAAYLKIRFYEEISKLKKTVLQIYQNLYERKISWNQELQTVLWKMTDCVQVGEKLFGVPGEVKEQHIKIKDTIKENNLPEEEQLYLLADMMELFEALERLQ